MQQANVFAMQTILAVKGGKKGSYELVWFHTAQGGGGVATPEGVQKSCRHVTSGHGLTFTVVFDQWFDLMILEVLSKRKNSMNL